MMFYKKILALLVVALLVVPQPGIVLLAEGEAPLPEAPVETPTTPVVEEVPLLPESLPEPEPAPEEQLAVETPTQETPTEEVAPGENGESGANGEEGGATEEETAPAGPGGDIETGDAGAISDTGNQVNTNTVETGSYIAASTPTEGESTETTTEDPEATTQSEAQAITLPNTDDNSASTTIENVADVENTSTTTADTGDNLTGGTGTSTIRTGDALAVSNIINVVNTNIINSTGFLLFLNMLFGQGSIDLSQIGWNGLRGGAGGGCDLGTCAGADFNLGVTNDANIDNSVVVRANTGSNGIDGNGTITTGDAYAASNIVNVANTNIVDSNYLLIALNNFGDLNGDIILPNTDFFSWFLNGFGLTVPGSLQIGNEATVTNTVETIADTGANGVSGGEDGGGTIQTGDALSASGVSNVINSTGVGGSQVFILLRVMGNWNGEIFNLPPGLSWAPTQDGVMIFSDPSGTSNGGLGGGDFNFSNRATVNNDVSVYALTGDNRVDGTGTIRTGDAYAASNIFNLINTTVIGRNMLFAALNIMGNWNGNLSFGQPDLFVGGRAELGDDQLRPGSPITYFLTITNRGNVRATNVNLRNTVESNKLELVGDVEVFSLGTLAPNESRDITFRAIVSDNMGYGEVPVVLEATATAREGDANPADNTEEIVFMAYNSPKPVSYIQTTTNNSEAPDLRITKTSNVGTTTIPGAVEYVIAIDNDGGSAYNAVLVDTMRDQLGRPVKEKTWDLGEIFPGEHIEVKYTMTFAEGMIPGLYTNEAQIFTSKKGGTVSGGGGSSNLAQATLTVVGPLTPMLGLSCGKYLTKYMRMGAGNDPKEVTKLQDFLRNAEGFENVRSSGFFDKATSDAVHAFQDRYREDVLTPWGIKQTTGYVYYTTQRKVNELYCQGQIPFVLSPEQMSEIQNYRSRVERSIQNNLPLPSLEEVGVAPGSVATVVERTQSESQVAGVLEAVSEPEGAELKESIRGWMSRSLDRLRRQTTSLFGEIFSWPTRTLREEARLAP